MGDRDPAGESCVSGDLWHLTPRAPGRFARLLNYSDYCVPLSVSFLLAQALSLSSTSLLKSFKGPRQQRVEKQRQIVTECSIPPRLYQALNMVPEPVFRIRLPLRRSRLPAALRQRQTRTSTRRRRCTASTRAATRSPTSRISLPRCRTEMAQRAAGPTARRASLAARLRTS